MKTSNTKEVIEKPETNWRLNAADINQDDKDLDDTDAEKEEEDKEEESGDWGDVDPAGGDAPTAPGSAV